MSRGVCGRHAKKSFLESLDLALKIDIAVEAFLLWGGEKERIEIQTKQAEIQKEQANAEKALAESSQVKQQMNLTVVDKLVTLLSGYEQQCISEEHQTFITYLIRVNDA